MAKRVVFFPGGGMGDASARTRLYYYLPALNADRISYHVASYSFHRNVLNERGRLRSPLHRLWLELLSARTFMRVLFCDTVWFQKLSPRPWMLTLARVLGKRIVYDLDDAIYLKPPEGEGRDGHVIESHDKNRRVIENIMRRASVVTVSGEAIANFARQYARDVRLLPSLVGEVAVSPSLAPDPPVIVWVGAPENFRYLLDIEDVLQRLQDETPGLVIRLITSTLADRPRFHYEHIPWSLAAEAEWIPHSTVGVAPLADDEWCRAKLNYKALVYMSRGVPAVVSPGGFPLEAFEEGESVLVARSAENWYHHLKFVIERPEQRARLSKHGLDVLRKAFTADVHVREFEDVLTG